MSLKQNGYQLWVPGQELVMLVIVDTRIEVRVSTYYNPTTEAIIRACKELGIPYVPILNMIADKTPEVHTLFIDVKKYLEAWAEED